MPAPLLPVLDPEDPRTELQERVIEALMALPGYFGSTTIIEGVDATDLFALNSLLGASIEQQVVDTLNRIRPVWDPDDEWAACRFVRHPQTFPDVRLMGPDGVVFGIELKGWYALAKEGEPSLRFKNTPAACAPHDLLCVVPWHLKNVLSGAPVVLEPWIQPARWVAQYRNFHWQEVRATKLDTTIQSPAPGTVVPYHSAGEHILDAPASDQGGNFGRIARIAELMDEFTTRTKQAPLLGVEARHWIAFLRQQSEGTDGDELAAALEAALKAKATKLSAESAAEVVALLRQIVQEFSS